MPTKHILASKTFWANILALVAAVSGSIGLDLGLDAETQASIALGAVAVVNIVLRAVTKEPVKVKIPTDHAVVLLALMGASLALSACAYRVAETPAQQIYAVEVEYQNAQRTILAYATSSAADAVVVGHLKRLDRLAHDAVTAARAAARSGDGAALPAALAAAQGAVREIIIYLREKGVLSDAGVRDLETGVHLGGIPAHGLGRVPSLSG